MKAILFSSPLLLGALAYGAQDVPLGDAIEEAPVQNETTPATEAEAVEASAEPPYGPTLVQIRASVVDLGDGERIENGVVLIEKGRIRKVGTADVLDAEFPIVEHEGWLTPGMVVAYSDAGVRGERWDSTRSLLPEARMADGLDAASKAFARAARAGVTSMVVAPDANNVVGGVTAVVKANGRVLERDASLRVSLSSAALGASGRTRMPTSYGGALAALDELLASEDGVGAKAKAGELPVLIEAGSRQEIDRAARFAQRHGLKGALRGARLAGELADVVKASGLGVVVGPYADGATMRTLSNAAKLVEAGVPIAFGLEFPYENAARLRFNAAQAISEGLAPDAAWKALTSDGARLAGVGDRVGRLARGLDADIVLWSGPPTSLTSKVVTVYVDGEIAHGGAE